MKLKSIRNLLGFKKKRKGLAVMDSFIDVFVGIIVIVVLVVLGSTISGVMFQNASGTIDTIQNATIKNSVTSAAGNSFAALQSSTNYINILVLAIIMLLIMGMIMAIRASTTRQGPRNETVL